MAEPAPSASIRLDKWLWAVRCYKTRSLATDACKGNHVKCNGRNAKPSQSIRVGDQVEFTQGALTRTYRVRELLERRVGAAMLDQYREDLTPQSAIDAAMEQRKLSRLFNAGRSDRPTKRDRRQMEKFRQIIDGS